MSTFADYSVKEVITIFSVETATALTCILAILTFGKEIAVFVLYLIDRRKK